MKIPLLAMHIMTTKTLNRVKEQARDDGRTVDAKQMAKLVSQNHALGEMIKLPRRARKHLLCKL